MHPSRTASAALSALAFLSYTASASEPGHVARLKAACEKGSPWRMPVPADMGLPEMETPIKLYGVDGKLMLVCNCTADKPGKNTGTWVSSDDFSERATVQKPSDPVGNNKPRFAHYLPGQSCTTAGSGTVTLRPADKLNETWGTFEPIEAK